jgi:alpha-D-ribose 1-methylphosphonate 5-triphosphate synthase subunit PhnG
MALHYQVVYYHRQLDSGKAVSRPIMSAVDESRTGDPQRSESPQIARRKAAMAVLAHAAGPEISAQLEAIPLPPYENLRDVESGLVMVRGRIGGDGAPFNLGEATISRAAVRLGSGEIGFGYTLGRDKDKARMIALCDALLQSQEFAGRVEAKVIAPLRAGLLAGRERKAAQSAATKVDFYTMVRGEG